MTLLTPSSRRNMKTLLYYDSFLDQNPLFHKKNSSLRSFLVSLYFVSHPITVGLLLEILRGRIHGPSPTSNFFGAVPQSPLSLRPWDFPKCKHSSKRPVS